jgi:polar amino acid transport system permease protein
MKLVGRMHPSTSSNLDAFPSPLWGGERGGGKSKKENAPTPNLSPHSQRGRAARGGGEDAEPSALFSFTGTGLPICPRHGIALAVVLAASVSVAQAQAGSAAPSIIATMLKWTPLLAQGFALNIAMSFLAMAIGTVFGFALGLGQVSLLAPVRKCAWLVTQFFRNSPWLVLLFYCMLLLPFEVRVGNTIIALPGWAKATFGLALPVMANVSELVRGAVQSIPSGQWEAAEALAFARLQTLRMIILPQCIKRMTPPWMNLYAILTVATPLTSVVGVSEAMTLTGDILSSQGRTELLVPMYLYLLMWFFIYCYPIARATAALERRFAVR